MSPEELMSVRQAAERLRVDAAEVERLASEGKLAGRIVDERWVLFAVSVEEAAQANALKQASGWLTVTEAASVLGITLPGVYHHIYTGKLTLTEMPEGKFLDRSQVEHLARNRAPKGNPSLLRTPPAGFLTPPQIAKRLGMNGSLIHRYLNEGRIVGKKDEEGWLVAEAEVERFAASRKSRGRPRTRPKAGESEEPADG